MKKFLVLALTALLLLAVMATATAESAARQNLMDILNRRIGTTAQEPEAPAEDVVIGVGTEVKVSDPFFKITRYSTYMGMSGSTHKANVLIELKNTSEATLYPNSAKLIGYDADGNVLFEETYLSMYTDEVAPGECLYINEWLYNYITDPTALSYMEVVLESRTSSYYDYTHLESESWIENGHVVVEVPNPYDVPMYDVDVTFVVSNDAGELLDISSVYSGSNVAVSVGGSFFMRMDVDDYLNGGYIEMTSGSVVTFAQIED